MLEAAARMSRLGGVAAIALAVSYLVITVLYVAAGAVPDGGGRAWLEYLGDRQATWWLIAGLSVLTDLLFLPFAAALFAAVRPRHGNAALVGAGLVGLFAVLDMAITWSNYAGLIALGGRYAAASGEAQRAALAIAAEGPAAILGSGLFKVYAILVPAIGILVLGWAMRHSTFGRTAASLGLLTGGFGSLAVSGSLVIPELGRAVVLTSVLTTVWVLLVGVRLLRPAAESLPVAAPAALEVPSGQA